MQISKAYCSACEGSTSQRILREFIFSNTKKKEIINGIRHYTDELVPNFMAQVLQCDCLNINYRVIDDHYNSNLEFAEIIDFNKIVEIVTMKLDLLNLNFINGELKFKKISKNQHCWWHCENRNHKILASLPECDDKGVIVSYHQIMECIKCESERQKTEEESQCFIPFSIQEAGDIGFRRLDLLPDGRIRITTFCPSYFNYEDRKRAIAVENRPPELQKIYLETTGALENGCNILAIAGVRAILEYVCWKELKLCSNQESPPLRSLLKELQDLLEKNKKEDRGLHAKWSYKVAYFVTDANKALHELEIPSKQRIEVFLEDVMNLYYEKDRFLKSRRSIDNSTQVQE